MSVPLFERHRVIAQLRSWISQRPHDGITSHRARRSRGAVKGRRDVVSVLNPVMVPVKAGLGSPYKRLAFVGGERSAPPG